MNEKSELVHFDGEEGVTPRLYRRSYSTASGRQRIRFYAVFTDHQGNRQKIALGKNLKVAIKRIYELDKENDNDVDFAAKKKKRMARGMTFGKWVERHETEITSWHRAPLERFFGNKRLTAIDDDAVIEYRKQRSEEKVIRHGKESKKTLSETTINKEVSALRKLLRMARKKEGIHDQVTTFPMARESSRKRTLSPEEYKRLLDKCPAWLRRACVMAYESSLSRSDLLELSWQEIDLQAGFIERSRNKTAEHDAEHVIPIVTLELWALIEELQAERRRLSKLANLDGQPVNESELVFTMPDGKPIHELKFEYHFRKARKAAGIKNFMFHDLRHCAITRWAAANVPTAAAMKVSGHKSVHSHKKYQNLQRDQLRAGFQNLVPNCSQEKTEIGKSAVSA